MQLAHIKTSPVVVLGPLELLEWPNETFSVGQHHQLRLTKEPLEPHVLKISTFVILRIEHWECSWHILKNPQ